MATTIPDLWSDDIKVDVLPPVAILRAQISFLERKTQGLLIAQVASSTNSDPVHHQLDLIAPALNGYRRTLLTVKHNQGALYPVTLQAECFGPQQPSLAASYEHPQRRLQLPEYQREANSQDEFIKLVRQVLQSGQVRALIESLIAKSNETRTGEKESGQPSPPAPTDPQEKNGS